jgi:hypothetical protein
MYADGWYGFLLGLKAVAKQLESLREAMGAAGRARPLHISVSPARQLDEDVVGAYAELGVDRLIVVPRPELSLDQLSRFVRRNAPARIGADAGDALGEREAGFNLGPLHENRGDGVRRALGWIRKTTGGWPATG